MVANGSNEDLHLIAVTGAQGVGKSTFCENLLLAIRQSLSCETHLMAGLGTRLADMGVPLGSQSTSSTIPAVFAAHLEKVHRSVAVDSCLHPTGIAGRASCTFQVARLR